ncbi:hypothetical protein APV28_4028 [Comamonas testosteroni]|nr:hypothetical protein APV28_4028 [Comamonas testosteroni]
MVNTTYRIQCLLSHSRFDESPASPLAVTYPLWYCPIFL